MRLFYQIYIMTKKLVSWQITYSDEFDQINGNILKVSPDFINILQENDCITIEGNQDDDFLFSVDNHTYKLRDIFLPSTMLLTQSIFELEQQNSPSQSHGRKIAYVSLQTAHYLKLEAHNIQYNLIYSELMNQAVSKQLFEESPKLWNLVISSGLVAKSVCSRFRITPNQLEQLIRYAPIIFVHNSDLPQLDETNIIVFSLEALLSALRHLIPFLIERGIIGEWFDYQQVASLELIKHQKVLYLLAKTFDFLIEGNQSNRLYQPMDIEQCKPIKFKCKVQSIVRFVLLEHALAKHQYSLEEMDFSVWNLVLTYLPLGLSDFEQLKAKKAIQELMGYYFLTIQKNPATIRIYYDPLFIGSTIKERLQFLRTFKKKYSLKEIEGIFSRMVMNEIQINDMLMKNFRKCGLDYEMKLVIPK